MRPLPWAPRPFQGEAFGSWIGRLAGRYRVRVLQLNSDLDLGVKTEGPLFWLLPSSIRVDTIERLARLTRLDEASIPAPTPYDSDRPTRHALYCSRCVFLNHAEVESPYWQETCLTPRDSACLVHRVPLATLRSRLVRESHNMLGLLKKVGRQELERRELERRSRLQKPHWHDL